MEFRMNASVVPLRGADLSMTGPDFSENPKGRFSVHRDSGGTGEPNAALNAIVVKEREGGTGRSKSRVGKRFGPLPCMRAMKAKEVQMDFLSGLSGVNWPSVLVATVAAFIVGSLWYSPLLFANAWVRELGLSQEKIKNANMAVIFGCAFLLNLVSAAALDVILGPESDPVSGLIGGLVVGVAFIAAALGVNYLFARKSLRLFLIDAGYFVAFFAVMGALLGAW
jgi:hypothetical protein